MFPVKDGHRRAEIRRNRRRCFVTTEACEAGLPSRLFQVEQRQLPVPVNRRML
jgi:hypothetical protein